MVEDLRIGNLLWHTEHGLCAIKSIIDRNGVGESSNYDLEVRCLGAPSGMIGHKAHISKFQRIPLNEEIVEHGFDAQADDQSSYGGWLLPQNDRWRMRVILHGNRWLHLSGSESHDDIEIPHVNDLQNLYYDMNNKSELKYSISNIIQYVKG